MRLLTCSVVHCSYDKIIKVALTLTWVEYFWSTCTSAQVAQWCLNTSCDILQTVSGFLKKFGIEILSRPRWNIWMAFACEWKLTPRRPSWSNRGVRRNIPVLSLPSLICRRRWQEAWAAGRERSHCPQLNQFTIRSEPLSSPLCCTRTGSGAADECKRKQSTNYKGLKFNRGSCQFCSLTHFLHKLVLESEVMIKLMLCS